MSDFKKYLNVYEFSTILPGNSQEIKFKPISTLEMKKLLLLENEKRHSVIEEAFDKLISQSVLNEDFNIEDLYIQDRFFLLVELRKKTKGESYNFRHNCEACKSQSMHSINLDYLPVKKLENIDKNLKLNDNITIELDLIKRKTEKEALSKLKDFNHEKASDVAEYMTLSYALSMNKIITPDGEEELELEDKLFLLNNITQGEFSKINEWYKDNDFGLDFTFDFECPHCGEKKHVEIPSTDFFF